MPRPVDSRVLRAQSEMDEALACAADNGDMGGQRLTLICAAGFCSSLP